jgi:adenylate kinase family enzyme
MRLHEFANQELDEGQHDPHIFKAIFMAGQPGAGKSFIARKLFAETGLRVVDIDKFEPLARAKGQLNDKNRDEMYDKFSDIAGRWLDTYMGGKLGVIIDGTAKNIDRIRSIKRKVEAAGYDCAMVFVNTDLETAMQRAKEREERTGRHVPPERIEDSWKSIQSILGQLQGEFSGNFLVVDNSSGEPELKAAHKWVRQFLGQPVHNQTARAWLSAQKGQQKSPE